MYWIKKFFTDREAHFRAFSEVFTVAAFTFALYVGSFLKASASSTSGTAEQLLKRGEVFLLIYALFGTLFYLSFIHVGKPTNGPKKFIGLLISLIIIPIVLMSGFDPTFHFIVNEDVNRGGYLVFLLFLFSYHALLFFQEIEPPSPEAVLNAEAKSMADKVRELVQ